MSNSNNGGNGSNRSLFLYTGLIFFVAIIMIIIAFCGQSNMEKNQPIQESVSSIEEKTARLSEDNRILLEQNQSLQDTNKILTEQISNMQGQIDRLNEETANNDLLLDIYINLYEGKKKKAIELLETVQTETLTEKQTTFYNVLVRKSK